MLVFPALNVLLAGQWMSRAHSLAGKMAGTTSAPVRSPYFTRSTAKLTRAKESLTEQGKYI